MSLPLYAMHKLNNSMVFVLKSSTIVSERKQTKEKKKIITDEPQQKFLAQFFEQLFNEIIL